MKTAQTILAQLGGHRFIAMTGARNFLNGDNALRFNLPRGAINGANLVVITLEPSDFYTVQFQNYRNLKINHISRHYSVPAENLRSLFTRETGLDVSL